MIEFFVSVFFFSNGKKDKIVVALPSAGASPSAAGAPSSVAGAAAAIIKC